MMISSKTCERRGLALAAGLALTVAASLAGAEPTRTDPVAAEALFKAARALVDAGSWAEGCKKFETSLALNPSASTQLNIARCHEHDGKLATAWGDYNRALVLNRETAGAERRKGLEKVAKQGVESLEPRLPKLRVVVASPPAGLEVLRDGTVLPAGALGEALPIDPGPHEISATAPGKVALKKTVTLEEGKTATVELTLAAVPAPVPVSTPVPIWVWLSGAGGLALGGAAVFFLTDDLAAIGALDDHCKAGPTGTFCTNGYDYAQDNERKNRGFGLAVSLGGASVIALGAAVTGLILSRKQEPAATTAMPWLGPNGAGLAMTGSF